MHMILNFSFLFIFVTLTEGIAHFQTALQQISSWMSANLHSITAKTACVAHKNFITDRSFPWKCSGESFENQSKFAKVMKKQC